MKGDWLEAGRRCQRSRRHLTMMATLAMGFSTSAGALSFGYAGIDGSADTTLTYAAQMRVDQPDPGLIGIANGGTARSVNNDNGDLNYKRGDFTSSLARIDEELQLDYRNVGFFARGSYFYDFQVAQDLDKLGPEGRERLKDRAQLLDLFATGDFDVAGHDLNLRIGNQVIDWGESTFIPNGLNVVNAIDVSRLRQPGSALKDALLPTPALQVSFDITATLSFSGYALARFDPVILDPDDAYFSTSDIAGDDGDRAVLGYGRRSDGHVAATSAADAEVYILRDGDRRPDGPGQFGVSLHEVVPALNDTEFGLYYLHYDSHLPLFSTLKQNLATPAAGSSAGNDSARYFLSYPGNIDVVGASFNALLDDGIALQGEYSYRPNLPLQLPGADLTLSALNMPSEIAPDPSTIALGAVIRGYRRVGAHQLQFTLSKLVARPGLGADQVLLLAEFGADYLNLPQGLKFNGPGVDLPSRPQDAASAAGSYQHGGFATRFSWGYRLLVQLYYLSLFHSIDLSPRLVYAGDVKGVGPSFNEGAQAVTTALIFDYLERWHAELSYTSYFGGRDYSGTDSVATGSQRLSYSSGANPLRDRDFVAVSLGYSF